MPAYDLSPYNLGRVANVDVDTLMIANQLVWEADTGPELFSVFDGAPISGLSSYNDSNPAAWLANQLYKYPGPDMEIVSVGIYIPPGSSLIGYGGSVALQFNDGGFQYGHSYTNSMPSNGSATLTGALAEGWNWTDFATPYPWTDAISKWVLAGYCFYERYLYNSTLTPDEIPSSSGLFEMVANKTGVDEPTRTFYTLSVGQWDSVAARSYGIDIRARLV